MRVWLTCIGEPLPIDPAGERPLRMGLIAQALVDRGHDVIWWVSTFDHPYKRHRFAVDTRIEVAPRYTLQLLHGMGYRTNISLRRIFDHRQVARRYRELAPEQPRPDLIMATVPTVELAAASVAIGRRLGVPVVLDVRDLWPDVMLDLVPSPLRPLGRLALTPMFRQLRRALGGAAAITAVSPSYLQWGLRHAGRAAREEDRVVPLGYPDAAIPLPGDASAEAILREMGVDRQKQVLWFIGMFGHYYDLTTVIAAARRMADAGRHEIQFVLSGAGHRDAEWRTAAAGLPNVAFTGWVTATQIAALQGSAWAGLAAYSAGSPQSLPNKLFEYMAGGLPVLSSLGEDARALLARHQCGITYEAENIEALIAAIDTLHRDPVLHARMAANSRAAFLAHYSADQVYARLISHLEALARSVPAGDRSPTESR